MKKTEKCYLLKDINWLCYVNKLNGKVEAIPYVYNKDSSAIKNLLTNQIYSGVFKEEFLKPSFNHKIRISEFRCINAIYLIYFNTSYFSLPQDLCNCLYITEKQKLGVDWDSLLSFMQTKLMTKKDLLLYTRKIAKCYKKALKPENKVDYIEDTKNF